MEKGTQVITPHGSGKVAYSFDQFVRVDLDNEFEQNKMFYRSYLFMAKDVKEAENVQH